MTTKELQAIIPFGYTSYTIGDDEPTSKAWRAICGSLATRVTVHLLERAPKHYELNLVIETGGTLVIHRQYAGPAGRIHLAHERSSCTIEFTKVDAHAFIRPGQPPIIVDVIQLVVRP